MGWLRFIIGPAIVALLAFAAGQAMALMTPMAASLADAEDWPSWHILAQNQLFDPPRDTSRGGLTQNQRSLLQNLLDLPGLTERETKLFRQTLERNARLSATAEEQLRQYLRQRLAELEREQEQQRLAELERQRQEEERQRAAILERQRQEEERQRAAELERQRLEEEQKRAAELEQQRQEEEQQRAAELQRQRQEADQQRAAELERQRQEEERERVAELERQRLEEEQKRRENEKKQKAASTPTPTPEILTSQQQRLLTDLIGLPAMSSVERGIMRKILEDNRRLSTAEEARLQQRYAALQTIEVPPAVEGDQPADQEDVAVLDPPEEQLIPEEAPINEPEEVDLLELLPRFKIEMPSPI